MAMPTADVEAIIPAAGQGTRLGLGPKAFISLEGQTLLERVVATMSAVAAHVIVAVAEGDVERANSLVGGPRVSVIAGGQRRSETLRKLVARSTAPWLLLHDIVHPFVSVELACRVLAAARHAECAAAAVPNFEFTYGIDGAIRAAPGEVMIVQKPIAFRQSAISTGYRILGNAESAGDLGALEILARAGVTATFVPGYSSNLKITTAADLTLARAVAALEKRDQT
jgi:2-C-methyl-D-erythritol 4-phosphate cytidylyltransferase